MKAIQIRQTGSYSALTYEDVPLPTPKSNEVLIRVRYIGVNYVDSVIRSGDLPSVVMPVLPMIPGVECSGIVEATGSEVEHVKPGDRVVFFGKHGVGCYAEYVVGEAAYVTPVPSEVPLDTAAVLPVNYFTAYDMLHHIGAVKRGQTILVHPAAGGVGTALIQLAKLAGLRIIGLVGSDEKKAYIKQQGADYGINYKTENVVERIREITDGEGVHVSFNATSGQTIMRDAEVLAAFGQMIVFGTLNGLPSGGLEEIYSRFVLKSIAVRVYAVYSQYDQNDDLYNQALKQLLRYAADGLIQPQIYQTFHLSEAPAAHRLLDQGITQGKILLHL
ncbi:zinc-binding dehydrogenase [Paenibacillus sp. P26]|nr:zinc-binding dehydrogenase [Paenibacillus sp. P26]UUZ96211.1 zinc-binding dehydrogenase [Paenibacillus sp. P25]